MSEKDNFLDEELDLDEETSENEDEEQEENPDADPELTKIDQNLLDEKEEFDKVQPVNLADEMQSSFLISQAPPLSRISALHSMQAIRFLLLNTILT